MEVSGVGADPLRTRRRDVVPLGLGRGEMRSCHLRTVRANRRIERWHVHEERRRVKKGKGSCVASSHEQRAIRATELRVAV